MLETKSLFIEYLKQKNLKWSKQREFIVDHFLSTHRHISTEELYRLVINKSPQIGYSTVHRTLKLLSECGLVSERKFGDRYTRYELKQKDQHHDHFICTKCGNIVEFECKEIEKMQEALAKERGFKVTHHKLELYGLCRNCKKTS
jgi:Fur family ferric uptake transcriptional regulator